MNMERQFKEQHTHIYEKKYGKIELKNRIGPMWEYFIAAKTWNWTSQSQLWRQREDCRELK